MTRFLSSAAVVALVSLTACISEMPRQLPTEPPPQRTLFTPSFVPLVASRTGLDDRSMAPNRRKYRDDGLKPTVAYKGMASMEMRTLLDKQGVAWVQVTTGSFEGSAARGTLEKIHMTTSGSSSVFNTRPATSTWETRLAGLIPGDTVRIQANVRGQHARVEVLDATALVGRLPDIAVVGLGGPSEVAPGVAATFLADVREVNGDVGARADCRMFVNGTPVDEATDIWVDAGDIVNCQFTRVFSEPGTYTVTVSGIDVDPTDWDETNNSRSMTVTVVPPGTPITRGDISVQDMNYEYLRTATRTGAYPGTSIDGGRESRSQMQVNGRVPSNIPQPIVRIEMQATAGGNVLHQSVLTQLAVYSYVSGGARHDCVMYSSDSESANVCRRDYVTVTDTTEFSYFHQTGAVTYYGETLWCNLSGCRTYQAPYVRETVTGWGSRYGLSAGTIVNIAIRFIDAQGTAHVINRSVTMLDRSENWDTTTCRPYFDGLGDVCYRDYQSGLQLYGTVGWP